MPTLPPYRRFSIARHTGRPAWWRWRTLAWAGLGTLLLAVTTLLAAVVWYSPQLPPLDRVTTYQPRQPLQVYTADGVEIAQFGSERRQFVPIAEIPLLLQQALLAVEDTRFREHGGIDPKGVLRALVAAATGGLRQGASTITQQVARTFFLSTRRTPERKLKEALLALQIERELSKDQILELYMNQIYLGQRAYGFAAAADTYFGKPLAALSIAEAAMLAGLPQNPSYANPVTNLARATQRQHTVLQRMLTTGVISAAQQAAARAEKLDIRSSLQVPLHAEHVAEMARRLVVERFGPEVYSQGIKVTTSLLAADQQAAWAALRRSVLAFDARQPWRGPEDHADLPTESSTAQGQAEIEAAAAQALKDQLDDEQLRVAIVLVASPRELRLQLATGEALRISGNGLRVALPGLSSKAAPDLQIARGDILRVWQPPPKPAAPGADNMASPNAAWAVTQWPEVQAAFVALDASSGRVRALVGGFDFARQPFNHVTQAWRQPGSSLKPFLYSAALENGVMPATLINDAPIETADGWAPQNADGQFDGPTTLRQALAKSKNLVSIRVLRQIGTPAALAWLSRFGFEQAKQPADLTLALGAGSTSPLQLAQAYAVLASGGWRVAPVVIERITDAHGKVLFEAPAAAKLDEAQRAVPARNVFVTNSLLNDVTRVGTAARAQQQLQRADLYGKTGTTNDAVDAWFAGFQAGSAGGAASTGLVAVAWMGFDQPQSLGARESGGGLALPIWIDYMAQALKQVPVGLPPAPPEGLLQSAGDWVYSEWAEGGAVSSIGMAGSGGMEGRVAPVLPPSAAAPTVWTGSTRPDAPPVAIGR
jgi:penicillin-binding protein 1A